MTTEQFLANQQKKIDAILAKNIPLALAVSSSMGQQTKRIFTEGLNSQGSVIGNYSQNPIYVNPKNSPKGFTTKGKTGKTKFKDGTTHKTGYFVNYLAYKKSIGRNQSVQTIDLFLFGNLFKDWAKAASIGAAKATKINQNNYVVTLKQENLDKVEQYKVTDLTSKEKKLFLDVLQFEFKKALA